MMCDCDGEDHGQPAPPDCQCEATCSEEESDDNYDED